MLKEILTLSWEFVPNRSTLYVFFCSCQSGLLVNNFLLQIYNEKLNYTIFFCSFNSTLITTIMVHFKRNMQCLLSHLPVKPDSVMKILVSWSLTVPSSASTLTSSSEIVWLPISSRVITRNSRARVVTCKPMMTKWQRLAMLFWVICIFLGNSFPLLKLGHNFVPSRSFSMIRSRVSITSVSSSRFKSLSSWMICSSNRKSTSVSMSETSSCMTSTWPSRSSTCSSRVLFWNCP